MPLTPFFETLTECMRRDNMLPFQTMGSFRIFLGNISVCMNHMFAQGVLGFAIKSCLVATVNLLYQDLFSLVEGLVFCVTRGLIGIGSGNCGKDKS
jgi:hypothetical protein